MVAIIPMSSSFFSTSPALTPIAFASSATLTTSEMRMTRFDARGTVISVFRCSFPGSARRFCGRLPPRMKSRSMVSSMSDFLMTLRPFFFLGAPSLGAASVPGAASAPRADGAPAGAVALRRSIFPSTFTPRISSNPGGGAGGVAGRGGGTGTAGRDELVGTRVALRHDPLRHDSPGPERDRRPRRKAEIVLQPLGFLVGERALGALAPEAELLGARQDVLRGDAPVFGQLVDSL